jgi:hypothetical protein
LTRLQLQAKCGCSAADFGCQRDLSHLCLAPSSTPLIFSRSFLQYFVGILAPSPWALCMIPNTKSIMSQIRPYMRLGPGPGRDEAQITRGHNETHLTQGREETHLTQSRDKPKG